VIINIASRAGTVGQPNTAAYGATKAAVASFARSWAAEYGPGGVRVNAVSPGPVYTNAAKRQVFDSLGEWTGLTAPPVDLLHKPCGHRVDVRVVCSQCGQDIDARDTEPVVGRGLIMHRRSR
jgi:NAD(P)-dependent dehydrogenase (short-subunit alcohol dehydrogenase family)